MERSLFEGLMRRLWLLAGLLWSAQAWADSPPAPKVAPQLKARQLSPVGRGACQNPRWSRDGKRLAYERVNASQDAIELHVLSGIHEGTLKDELVSLPRELVARSSLAKRFKKRPKIESGQVCRELSWGPLRDPASFAYSCNLQGEFQVFLSDGKLIAAKEGSAGQPAVPPFGESLVMVSGRQPQTGLSYLKSRQQTGAMQDLAREHGRVDRTPAFSPKGEQLVFVGHRKRGADLYLIRGFDKKAPKAERLTRWTGDELNPSWSPDGQFLAFFSNHYQREPHLFDLYVMKAKPGAKPIRIAMNVVLTENGGPGWTPDGRFLIYVKNEQAAQAVDPLYAAAADGSGSTRLNTGTVSNRDPNVIDHEGRWWVAYSALGGGDDDSTDRTWRKVFMFPLDELQEQTKL